MRGTLCYTDLTISSGRFIPAHAGNTAADKCTPAAMPVYPRACGEHLLMRLISAAEYGLSPRMRGTHGRIQPSTDEGRFIPACAGNPPLRIASRHQPTVYPRVCGEHGQHLVEGFRFPRFIPAYAGNTPPIAASRVPQRFIPAHAGNTWAVRRSVPCSAVYPRACGERASKTAPCRKANGLSPRMRGTRR